MERPHRRRLLCAHTAAPRILGPCASPRPHPPNPAPAALTPPPHGASPPSLPADPTKAKLGYQSVGANVIADTANPRTKGASYTVLISKDMGKTFVPAAAASFPTGWVQTSFNAPATYLLPRNVYGFLWESDKEGWMYGYGYILVCAEGGAACAAFPVLFSRTGLGMVSGGGHRNLTRPPLRSTPRTAACRGSTRPPWTSRRSSSRAPIRSPSLLGRRTPSTCRTRRPRSSARCPRKRRRGGVAGAGSRRGARGGFSPSCFLPAAVAHRSPVRRRPRRVGGGERGGLQKKTDNLQSGAGQASACCLAQTRGYQRPAKAQHGLSRAENPFPFLARWVTPEGRGLRRDFFPLFDSYRKHHPVRCSSSSREGVIPRSAASTRAPPSRIIMAQGGRGGGFIIKRAAARVSSRAGSGGREQPSLVPSSLFPFVDFLPLRGPFLAGGDGVVVVASAVWAASENIHTCRTDQQQQQGTTTRHYSSGVCCPRRRGGAPHAWPKND